MNSIVISTVILPGVVALLLFLVFTYLYEQSRQPYFRAWQLAWAAYTLQFLLNAWSSVWQSRAQISFLASQLLVVMSLCILVSTRLTRRLSSSERLEALRLRWYEIGVAVAGVGLAYWDVKQPLKHGVFSPEINLNRLEMGLAAVLGYSSFHFYLIARRRGSFAFRGLSFSLALWAVLMFLGQFKAASLQMFGGDLLGPVPQMLLGVAMVMVLFENERNAVQENALAFSTLGVDPMRLLAASDVVPSMQGILARLVAPLPTSHAVICISERWRAVRPSVQLGFSPEFAANLDATGAGESLCELAYRRGGFVSFRTLPEMAEPLPAFPGGRFGPFRGTLAAEDIPKCTLAYLPTGRAHFGG